MSGARDLDLARAIAERRSIRRFRPEPVPPETVERILELAARAPSGANMQPWQVHVVTGEARRRVGEAVAQAAARGERSPDYTYYPDDWFEPYRSRRRRIGFALYDLLGIARDDKAAREAQSRRNFVFFDAPVGLFVFVDRRLNLGSWLDCGMFLQNLCLAARACGLETCAQASWVPYAGTVRAALGIDDGAALLSGVALGHPDPAAPENALTTERAAPAAFTTWHGDTP
jgi:nitroreductase